MTRFSPIIGYLLAWQLLMPLLCFFFSVTWWIVAVTAIVYSILMIFRNWEKNSYSKYSAIVVAVLSILLASFEIIAPMGPLISIVVVLWLYAQIAFTATSPYPLSIRMPLIIYTLAYIFMIPKEASALIIVPPAIIFSSVMSWQAVRWRAKTSTLTTEYGPSEPPYSFSLAIAIVAAVVINLCLRITEYTVSSPLPRITCLVLLSLICAWLLFTKDWKKNILAVTALVLMITLHVVAFVCTLIDSASLTILTYILSVSPVMFHTTAPVFRGMRIAITLFAVYSVLNRHSFIAMLADTRLLLWQQHAINIAIDAILAIGLILMAIHWKKFGKVEYRSLKN